MSKKSRGPQMKPWNTLKMGKTGNEASEGDWKREP